MHEPVAVGVGVAEVGVPVIAIHDWIPRRGREPQGRGANPGTFPVTGLPRRGVRLAPLQPSNRALNAMDRAVSSAVERFVYTEDVGGSNPSPPTRNGHASPRLIRAAARFGSTRWLRRPIAPDDATPCGNNSISSRVGVQRASGPDSFPHSSGRANAPPTQPPHSTPHSERRRSRSLPRRLRPRIRSALDGIYG